MEKVRIQIFSNYLGLAHTKMKRRASTILYFEINPKRLFKVYADNYKM